MKKLVRQEPHRCSLRHELVLCYNKEQGLAVAVVDLVKDPNPAGSLTRSTTRNKIYE